MSAIAQIYILSVHINLLQWEPDTDSLTLSSLYRRLSSLNLLTIHLRNDDFDDRTSRPLQRIRTAAVLRSSPNLTVPPTQNTAQLSPTLTPFAGLPSSASLGCFHGRGCNRFHLVRVNQGIHLLVS
jgi:hypothetical protein